VRAEVDAIVGDRHVTVEDMRALRYTTRVINESMRLYPQPPVLIRRALEDDKFGDITVRGRCVCLLAQQDCATTGCFMSRSKACSFLFDVPRGPSRTHFQPLASRPAWSLQVEKGSDIFISVWNLHRSPQLWDAPTEFRPERFGPLDGPIPNEVTTDFK
jgi:beta-ring hydroxylase